MERNMKLLLGVSAISVMALFVFAQAVVPKASAGYSGGGIGEGAQAISPTAAQGSVQVGADGVQVVSIKALDTGAYDKPIVHVKAGQPVKFEFSAQGDAGCGRQLIIPQFGVSLVSLTGETKTATFTPPKGVYAFHCSMNMFRGTLYAD